MHLRWKIAQFCERIWWRLYLHKRDKDAYIRWKQGYWRRFLEQIHVDVPAGSTVADLGCGPAGIFTILPHQRVEAVDPLITDYQRDLPHFEPKDYPSVRFTESTLEAWQPTHQAYTHIFCINAINHVSDINLALSRIKQAANDQATVVISTDAHRRQWMRRVFALAPADVLHPHQHTKEGYMHLFAQAGLTQKPEIYLLKRELIFDYLVFVWRSDA